MYTYVCMNVPWIGDKYQIVIQNVNLKLTIVQKSRNFTENANSFLAFYLERFLSLFQRDR